MNILPKPATARGPAERFTGDVWVDTLFAAVAPSRARLAVVRFAPGARTAWHRHLYGQMLHVTQGIGLVQARGHEVMVMRPGDTVWTPPGQWHWHGATPDSFMTHLAIAEGAPDPSDPDVEWGEHVIENEY